MEIDVVFFIRAHRYANSVLCTTVYIHVQLTHERFKLGNKELLFLLLHGSLNSRKNVFIKLANETITETDI